MRNKTVLAEAEDIQRAVEMIELGARMQMLESETKLSRERLLKLYKEVRGVSPPKGMLPFSTDWFMTTEAGLCDLDSILKGFRLYIDHIDAEDMEEVLSLTRAWTLVRFFEADLLHQATCTSCGGTYVAHAYDPMHEYVCGLCNMPSRAGKGRRTRKSTSERSAMV